MRIVQLVRNNSVTITNKLRREKNANQKITGKNCFREP